jgi:transposase
MHPLLNGPVCVINIEGKVLSQFTVEHSADGIALLVHRLAKFGEPIDIPIGIERRDGRLVDLLLEAGHPVVPVSPNAIKTWREGEVLSGAKSAAAPYSGETKAVRTVVRTRDDLVHMRVAAVNQLAALLDTHWPGAKAIFADLESKIALEFLSRYPTPAAAAHLGVKRIAAFCAARGYSGTSQTAPRGGSVTLIEWSRPCDGTGLAVTPPMFP